jgi:hypothetical protein
MAVNIPNGHKIHQHFPFQDSPKYSQIGIFGMKINHLATLKYNNNKKQVFREKSLKYFEVGVHCHTGQGRLDHNKEANVQDGS